MFDIYIFCMSYVSKPQHGFLILPCLNFQVATKVTRPYFDFTNTNDSSEAPYRGYAVDLIDAIFKIVNKDHNLNWEYEFYAVQKTGNPIPGSKKWDGLLGDVMEHVS